MFTDPHSQDLSEGATLCHLGYYLAGTVFYTHSQKTYPAIAFLNLCMHKTQVHHESDFQGQT